MVDNLQSTIDSIFSQINLWFPWFTIFSDVFIIQFFILYTFYVFVVSTNLYYSLFYLIALILFLGLFLALYQVELFAAFLWLTEVIIVLVCLFLLFNTSPSGNINIKKNAHDTQRKIGIFSSVFLLSLNFTYFMLPEYCLSDFLLTYFVWEDYYEALSNENMNDLYGLFISYYWINSVEFVIIGLVLLVGSLICVKLNQFLKTNKTLSYVSFFDMYDFFKDLVKILFLRKQNLVDQENTPASTRSFKKKINK